MPNLCATSFDPLVSSSPQLSETHLDQLATQGFCTIQNLLAAPTFEVLQQESHHLTHQPAKVFAGTQQQIRNDTTCWIEPQHHASALYLTILDAFAATLNQAFFMGIRWTEAHYAHYAIGQFYAAHRDNPIGSDVRAISSVLYLNDTWDAAWGGALYLQDRSKEWQTILPESNTMVLFDSNLLHEVTPTQHSRRSIAGWMRRDTPTEQDKY